MGNLIRRSFGLTHYGDDAPAGDYSSDVQPPARDQRGPVSVEQAVTLPAVFRAIQLIQAMGSNLVRDGLASWRDEVLVAPQPALIRQPDPWRSRRSFAARFLTNAATEGNNFLLRHRLDGVTSSTEVLDPFATAIRWEKGRKLFDTVVRGANGGQVTRTYTEADVDHVWCGLELPGHDRALGPIAACRYALEGHLDSREYAAGWFQNTDQPSGVLTTDQPLDATSAAEYKRLWRNPDGDLEAGKRGIGPQVRVLGRGLSYAPILLKPADAQWLESQAFGVVDVARMFGIPPDKLAAAVEGTSLTYSTTELVDRAFLRDTLLPVYMAPLEDALTNLLPRGQTARVGVDEFLRPDPKTQAEVDKTYLDAGVISREEVRTRMRWAGPPPEKPAAPAAPADQEVPAP